MLDCEAGCHGKSQKCHQLSRRLPSSRGGGVLLCSLQTHDVHNPPGHNNRWQEDGAHWSRLCSKPVRKKRPTETETEQETKEWPTLISSSPILWLRFMSESCLVWGQGVRGPVEEPPEKHKQSKYGQMLRFPVLGAPPRLVWFAPKGLWGETRTWKEDHSQQLCYVPLEANQSRSVCSAPLTACSLGPPPGSSMFVCCAKYSRFSGSGGPFGQKRAFLGFGKELYINVYNFVYNGNIKTNKTPTKSPWSQLSIHNKYIGI